jgi:DNA topoisomerase I
VKITKFEKCDFTPIATHIEAERARVKHMSKAEKQATKEKKEKDEAPYATCLFNGRPEKVGSFRIEPPGLFRGRGEHPKKGCLKVSFLFPLFDEVELRIRHSRNVSGPRIS